MKKTRKGVVVVVVVVLEAGNERLASSVDSPLVKILLERKKKTTRFLVSFLLSLSQVLRASKERREREREREKKGLAKRWD